MKKIVALALCLVLDLSLCAVAFAATTTDTLKASDEYKIVKIEDATASTADIAKTAGSSTTTYNNTTGEKIVTIVPDSYVVASATYYETDKSAADYRLQKGDTIVCYLKATTSMTDVKASKTIDKVLAKKDTLACGDYTDLATGDVYMIGTKAYAAGTVSYALYNNKVIAIGAEITATEDHDYDGSNSKTAIAYDAKGNVVSFTCGECGNTYTVVKELAADYTGKFHAVVTADTKLNGLQNANFVLLGAAAGTTAAEGVTSAKTFDAGIAMYVGMSLMAVTGSAVVIGKKKEF